MEDHIRLMDFSAGYGKRDVIRSGKREDIISSASLSELYGTRINVLRRNGRAIAYAADL